MKVTASMCALIFVLLTPAWAASRNDKVKDFTFVTIEGKKLDTGKFRGMPIVVAVLSPW